jgi:hypothetical protein
VSKEKDALKKLENVKKDHQKRLDELQSAQVSLTLYSKFSYPPNSLDVQFQ